MQLGAEVRRIRKRHFVVATEALSGACIVRLGKRRWAIKACFKVLKHQFGWDAFGQGTLLGMYRWWITGLHQLSTRPLAVFSL